jgi:hypothetical protein
MRESRRMDDFVAAVSIRGQPVMTVYVSKELVYLTRGLPAYTAVVETGLRQLFSKAWKRLWKASI